MIAGEWLTDRGSPRNMGRCEIAGRYPGAPKEQWNTYTGADIRYARTVRHPHGPAALVQAGTTLQLHDWRGGMLWANHTLGVQRVAFAGALADDAPASALVVVDDRTIAAVDLADGTVSWTWQSPASSSLTIAASSQLFRAADGGIRWVCFPRYATVGACFDLSNPLTPAKLWEVDYGETYDTGFGPQVIVADVYGTGTPHIVISSRTGSAYAVDTREQRTTGAQVVLGRQDGHLYQAIIDPDSGHVTDEVTYRPDEGDYPCARPYGLLQAVTVANQRQDIVLVSCQVEEYFAVTRHDDSGLSRRWGAFVEKDWPVDRLELRPQVSSIVELAGRDTPDLVVGFWDGDQWSTRVIELMTGQTRAELTGRYFWGCEDVDGDGIPELVVSEEGQRTPGQTAHLEIRDPTTMAVKGSLPDAGLVLSTDSDLPQHVGFYADRRSIVPTPGVTPGVLVRIGAEIARWGGPGGDLGPHGVADAGFGRADVHDGELILSDATGRLARFDDDLREVARIAGIHGRACQPLVWQRRNGREVVLDLGGRRVVGGRLSGRDGLDGFWEVTGTLPALHRDDEGRCRLAVGDDSDPHEPRVRIHTEPGHEDHSTVEVRLPAPAAIALTPYGAQYRLLVNLRTGIHTTALAVLAADGRTCWDDPSAGCHPQRPAVAPTLDGPLVVADDHGRLRIYDAGRGVLVGETDWTAAYTVPVAVPDDLGQGTDYLLRVDGVQGIETVGTDAARGWRVETSLWEYFGGSSAVGRAAADGSWVLGSLTYDGRFDAIDVETGRVRWTFEVGEVLPGRSVAAGDLDGDGRDEFIVGTRDGRLLCLAEDGEGRGSLLWTVSLPASVTSTVVADIDGDGFAEILAATADGAVRLLADDVGDHR